MLGLRSRAASQLRWAGPRSRYKKNWRGSLVAFVDLRGLLFGVYNYKGWIGLGFRMFNMGFGEHVMGSLFPKF